MGDFNLDWNQKKINNYPFKNYFEDIIERLNHLVLVQLVKCITWPRQVNNIHRESILDPVHSSDPTMKTGLYRLKPMFGDNLMVVLD